MLDCALMFCRYNTIMKIVFLGEPAGVWACLCGPAFSQHNYRGKHPALPISNVASVHLTPWLFYPPPATSFSILYLMRGHKVVKVTYDKEQDTFRYLFLVLPCILLAVVLHSAWTPFEVCGQLVFPP